MAFILSSNAWVSGDDYAIALFYRYVLIAEPAELVEQLKEKCQRCGLLGRILVSREGVNGTLAGGVAAVNSFVAELSADPRFANIDWKFTNDRGDSLPFLGLSIRVVDEIIASGRAGSFINSNISFNDATYGGITGTGTHLTPTEFHNALARNDGIILDIRNEFEFDIGHFKGSKNLKTFNYAETFDALDQVLGPAPQEGKHEVESRPTTDSTDNGDAPQQNIYMYCTGGIRCEKASAYLCAKGYSNVYQLEGGIHRYLETFPDGGLFQGKNFVFDSRVSVGPTAAPVRADGETDTTAAEAGLNTSASTGENVLDPCKEKTETMGGELDAAQSVVGRCIDCASQHDVYSGFIVCTVCRMPVLVCPSCVQSNPAQGEYHCSRHRDLKELYFTVLTSFTLEQLQAQLAGLEELVKDSASHLEQVRMQERQQRALQKQRQYDAKRKACMLHQKASDSATNPADSANMEREANDNDALSAKEQTAEELSIGAQLGKTRRRTLRKQIERLQARIAALTVTTPATSSSASTNQAQCESTVAPIAEAVASTAATGAETSVADGEVQYNPKTRGGWGFWKT